jgi:hypothetical protein
MAQASKAIVPKDAGGPTGKRIAVSVQGGSSWALRVGAYVTARKNSADWRASLSLSLLLRYLTQGPLCFQFATVWSSSTGMIRRAPIGTRKR